MTFGTKYIGSPYKFEILTSECKFQTVVVFLINMKNSDYQILCQILIQDAVFKGIKWQLL